MLRGKSNRFRAAVAALIKNGTYQLVDLSPVQLARLVDVNVGYVTAELGCAVRHGPRGSTVEIDELVRKYGVETVRTRCDRAAPSGAPLAPPPPAGNGNGNGTTAPAANGNRAAAPPSGNGAHNGDVVF
jgi:hypothetical protein